MVIWKRKKLFMWPEKEKKIEVCALRQEEEGKRNSKRKKRVKSSMQLKKKKLKMSWNFEGLIQKRKKEKKFER